MATSDYDPLAQPLAVIQSRLAYHSVDGSGRMLDGMRLDVIGEQKRVGVSDLPYVQPQDMSFEEVNFAGRGHPTESLQGSTNREATISVAYVVRTRLDYGLIRTDALKAFEDYQM